MTASPPPKQAVRYAPISGQEGERHTAKINTGLPTNMTWTAVASNLVRTGTGSEWWFIPRPTYIAFPRPAVVLSVRWQT